MTTSNETVNFVTKEFNEATSDIISNYGSDIDKFERFKRLAIRLAFAAEAARLPEKERIEVDRTINKNAVAVSRALRNTPLEPRNKAFVMAQRRP